MSVSLRKKIAQMLCFGFDGAHWSEALKLQEWLSSPDGLGWLIEFNYDCHTKTYGKNIQSFEQLQRFNQQIKDFYAHIHPNALPLWLSIDVE
ncbi:MAG: beta-N-acetylhexosaminidase, partial [Pseudomonadota bacterium]|nr:beta-N-acetylhexosaminidase [Pseudomonadota bacterium]